MLISILANLIEMLWGPSGVIVWNYIEVTLMLSSWPGSKKLRIENQIESLSLAGMF